MKMYSLLQDAIVLLCLLGQISVTEGVAACDSKIWCDGQLLHDVQMAQIFPDSKTFVDMNIKVDPEIILQSYAKLRKEGVPSKEQLQSFIETYFEGPGMEFESWTPPDYVENPAFLEKIKDGELKQFGAALCKIWSDLGRKIKADVKTHQERYSLLHLPNPFIVPGGRFREIYYWDSYWVVKGLLVCGMTTTVRGMLENLISFVKTFGLVPNGGRIYYTRRSQPPLLIPMVEMYMQASNDTDFLRENIAYLEKEYSFWTTNRSVQVHTQTKSYTLNRYDTPISKPRPESYREDLNTVSQSGLSQDAEQELYSNIASGAETGWDFSSRWFSRDFGSNGDRTTWLKYTNTKDVVPVDLNSILCLNEGIMSRFYSDIGNKAQSDSFASKRQERINSINKVLWNSTVGTWFDHHISTNTQNAQFFPSNVFPLFADCFEETLNNSALDKTVLQYLKNEDVLNYESGIPTSLLETGQQWDFPNAWPPLQHVVIMALAKSDVVENRKVALQLAQTWVRSNLIGWKRTQHMFEKYVVTAKGSRGGGGEYDVQEGFGWSNGVILDLLDTFGAELYIEDNVSGGTCARFTINLAVTSVLVCLFIVLTFGVSVLP